MNHETTHQIISHTTPHGFIQEALELCREGAWDEPRPSTRAAIDALRSALFDASSFLQEAAATYCGLVDYIDEALANELNRLPGSYRQGYDLFHNLLADFEFDSLTKYRIVRAIACRAMQTSIFDDWIVKQLWLIDNLRTYLAIATNNPNERLRRIIRALTGVGQETLARWAGGHFRLSDTFTLTPPVPLPLVQTGLEFYPLPSLQEAQDRARKILQVVFPGRFKDVAHDADPRNLEERLEREFAATDDFLIRMLCHPGAMEVAIQPPSFRSTRLSQISWAMSADLVTIDRNVFDRPVRAVTPTGRHEVPPQTAKMFFWRPGDSVARERTMPLPDVRNFLEFVDPERRLTICLAGEIPWLPSISDYIQGEGQGGRNNWIAPWTLGRSVLIYTSGTQFGFHQHVGFIQGDDDTLLMCRIPVSPTWSLAVLRRSSALWPMVVHPIMHPEWDAFELIGHEQYGMEEVFPARFFGEEAKNCIRILSFLRAFRGSQMPESEWRQASERVAAEMMRRHELIAVPRWDSTAFRDQSH